MRKAKSSEICKLNNLIEGYTRTIRSIESMSRRIRRHAIFLFVFFLASLVLNIVLVSSLRRLRTERNIMLTLYGDCIISKPITDYELGKFIRDMR